MAQKQRQKVVRELLPKRLKLVLREWDNDNGTVSKSYRARIWHHKRQKYNFISLKATNEIDAITEALEKYGALTTSIDKNLPISRDARKLEHYIGMFIDYMDTRAKNKKITQKRVVVVGQLLRSLEKFYDENNQPQITALPDLYEQSFEDWRDKSLTRLTAKPLTPRSRNNETNAHRQFFGFLKDREIVAKVPEANQQKIEQTNHPFPQEHYAKLLSVSRKEISEVINPKTKWNWQCMRTVILLMSGTGCRVTETHNLRWKDIFLDTKKNPRIFFQGKGKEREISISPRIYGYLEELKQFKTVYGKDWEWNEKDYPYVFSSWKMVKTPNQYDSYGRRRWYEKAGLDPKSYPLVCFRHKFISDALRNGTHALQIAFYTGTSVKMIQQTYGKITPPDLFEQVFASAPDEALRRKESSKWFNELLSQKK